MNMFYIRKFKPITVFLNIKNNYKLQITNTYIFFFLNSIYYMCVKEYYDGQ